MVQKPWACFPLSLLQGEWVTNLGSTRWRIDLKYKFTCSNQLIWHVFFSFEQNKKIPVSSDQRVQFLLGQVNCREGAHLLLLHIGRRSTSGHCCSSLQESDRAQAIRGSGQSMIQEKREPRSQGRWNKRGTRRQLTGLIGNNARTGARWLQIEADAMSFCAKNCNVGPQSFTAHKMHHLFFYNF